MSAGKKLSNDDRILWGKVARSTRALPGRMDEIDAFEVALAQSLIQILFQNPH